MGEKGIMKWDREKIKGKVGENGDMCNKLGEIMENGEKWRKETTERERFLQILFSAKSIKNVLSQVQQQCSQPSGQGQRREQRKFFTSRCFPQSHFLPIFPLAGIIVCCPTR